MDNFLRFVSRPNQAFICFDVGNASDSNKWTAKIHHRLEKPAPAKMLETLMERLEIKLPEAMQAFYRQHNGCELYCDTLSDSAGVSLGSIDSWPELNEELNEWVDILDEDEKQEVLPAWFEDAIAIGEAPQSGNYLLLVCAGEQSGSIYYFNHDGFEITQFAASWEEFLARLITDPVQLLMDLGCYVCYSDGKTDIQWTPEQYL